jgi:membrane protease YdiL (CAAX protease family)
VSTAGSLTLPERPEGLPPRGPSAGRPWRALAALPIAIAALVGGTVVYFVVGAVRGALTDAPDPSRGVVGVALHGSPPLLTLSATLAQDLVLVAGALLAAAAASGGRLRPGDLGLRGARLASSVGLVLAGYVVFVLVSAAWTSALGIQDRENVAIDLGTRDSAAALVGAAVLVCVVAPVCEELFFRGYLFAALRRRGLVPAAAITGLAFGLAHVASAPIGFIVPLAVLGVVLCLVYERTGSLYPCMALHALNNSIAFGVADGRAWLVPACIAASVAGIASLSRVARSFA